MIQTTRGTKNGYSDVKIGNKHLVQKVNKRTIEEEFEIQFDKNYNDEQQKEYIDWFADNIDKIKNEEIINGLDNVKYKPKHVLGDKLTKDKIIFEEIV